MDRSAAIAEAIAQVESLAAKSAVADSHRYEASVAMTESRAAYHAAEIAAVAAAKELQAARDELTALALALDRSPSEPFTMDDGPMYAGIFGW